MSRAGMLVWRVGLAVGMTVGLCHPLAMAGPVPHPELTLQPAADARFASEHMEVVLDSARPVRAIPIQISAADSDRLAQATSDDPGILTIERSARILPGQSTGYLLVRPVAAGETTLRIAGSSIAVRIAPAAPHSATTNKPFGPTPELLTPLSGAGVWGTIHVGAAYWLIPGEPNISAPPTATTTPTTIKLRIGDGPSARTLEPVWTSKPEDGPLLLCSFQVDLADRGPGPCTLRAIRTDAAGVEHTGDPAVVQVIAPKTGPDGGSSFVEGECETDYGLLPPKAVGPPKPPPSASDRTASGGRFFPNGGADPRFRFPLEVPSDLGAGWYQVMMTAGGDAASGTLPSIGITIDEAQRPITASAIAQPGWHRIAIGTPVRLEPGRHVIRCDFVNDFYARGSERNTNADRNLRLDRIEIARVANDLGGPTANNSDSMSAGGAMAAPPAASGGSGDSMMSMNAMSGPTGGSAAGGWPAIARAGTRPPVRIAFERPLDNQPISGEVEIRGAVWSEAPKSPPPQVALLINGREVQRQRSDAPRFIVPPETFRSGENTVQLRALTDFGFAADTAAQRLSLPAELALPADADHPRFSRRFTIYDPVWSPSITKSLKDGQGGDQRKSAPIASNGQIALTLPEELVGSFDVWVECRSNGRDRRVELSLQTDANRDIVGPPAPLAAREVPNWFDSHNFTPDDTHVLHLAQGPKRLLIWVPPTTRGRPPAKNEPNAVWLQGVRLVEHTALTATAAPRIALDYPKEDQTLRDADALVATVSDANTLDWAEPVIDGKPTGLRFDVRRSLNGVGRILVPISLRSIEPGEHQVSLRITDTRGKTADSPSRPIRVLADSPTDEPTVYDRAVMLLDRFAYGPDTRELADVLRLGPDAYLQSRLDASTGDDLSEDAAQDLAAVKLANPRSGYDVSRRAVQQAIATGNPFRNRFTLWAENHFSTWVRKDEAWRKLDEHERFSELGVASFYDLLAASATSPAMLRYLDQERSYAGKLNENYAREIMELHTLGVHGGYTQQDVTNLAHVLTGWTTARTALASAPDATADEDGLSDDFRFDPLLCENLSEFRDVVGYRFAPVAKQDRHQRVLLALEILAAHPSTARFVCTKLANHYVGVPPDPQLIDDLASTFTRTGGDMKQVLLTLSTHPAFWRAAAAKRLSHPTDYAFRLARSAGAGAGWMNPHEIGQFLDSSGQGLFERATPDGFPEIDTEAMNSNAILQRWKLAGKADYALADGIPPNIRWSNEPITPALRQTIVDILAIRLTGRLLGEASNTQALHVLEECRPAPDAKPAELDRDSQIKTIATFIAQLPEANIR